MATPRTSSFAGMQLPNVGGPADLSRQGLLTNYNQNWQASRNANQDLFNRTVTGFDSILAQQKSDLSAVGDSYRSRQRAVVKGLAGANEANERDIQRQFASMLGGQMTDLAGRGLGNSTVRSSVERGIGHSQADALTRSRNDFASTIANMRTNWGMAALGQQQQSALANSGLANQQASFLNQNTNIGYPDMGAYASMIATIPDQNLDRLLNSGGFMSGQGGGGFGGGGPGLLQFDPNRPVGGMRPMPQGYIDTADYSMYGAPGLGGQAFNAPQSGGFAAPPGGPVASFDPNAWSGFANSVASSVASGANMGGQLGGGFMGGVAQDVLSSAGGY